QTVPLEVGGTAQISASVTGGEADTDKSVTWTTSDANIASITPNGNVVTVTGQGAGTATITATANADANVKASAVVQVSAAAPTEPSVSIQRITTFVPGVGDVDAAIDNIRGQINIIANLEVPTGAQINRVEFLIGTQTVCSQDFSGAEAADAAAAPI